MKIRSLFYALLVFALVSCGGKDNPVTPTISVFGVPGEYSVPAEGVSASVNVTASMSWVASSTVSWITVTPTAGKGGSQVPVEITVAENFEQERTGEVVFTVSGTTKSTSIQVTQEAAEGVGADDPPVVVGEQVFLQKFDDGAGLGEFTIVTVERGGFPGDIWTTDSAHPEYGAKAQAYVSATATRYKTECMLVSPLINLKGHNRLYLRFLHALNYANNEPVSNFIGLKISDDKGESWHDLTIPNLPAGSNFEFVSSGDINLYAYRDKVVQLAFVYKSTTTIAPTWEVKQVLISEKEEEIVKVDLGDTYTGVPAWMELPQVTNPDNFRIHTALIGENNYRNYSFTYDPAHLVAPWVAYPLCDLYTKKTVARTDNWRPDPFVTVQANYQSSPTGYDRGHQIASADRQASTSMNEQTFYFTNITPQLSGLNQGIWANLEEKVRDWSASKNGTDTLYVVTGCVVNDQCLTVTDHNGKPVSIPSGYYKALLRKAKDSGNYIGAAFYLDHSNAIPANTALKTFAMSISELETKVGMTFFVNLPIEQAGAIKAQDPKSTSFWNLK